MLGKVKHRQTLVYELLAYAQEGQGHAYVDDGIIDLVMELNAQGMVTTRSCQGDLREGAPRKLQRDAYVEFVNADDAVTLAYIASCVVVGKTDEDHGITVTIHRVDGVGQTHRIRGRATFDPRLIKGLVLALQEHNLRDVPEAPDAAAKTTRGSIK